MATANDEKFNKKQVIQQVEEDKELERIKGEHSYNEIESIIKRYHDEKNN